VVIEMDICITIIHFSHSLESYYLYDPFGKITGIKKIKIVINVFVITIVFTILSFKKED